MRGERLSRHDGNQFQVTVMANMPALKAESVGLKLTELTISNLIEVGKNIAQDDPELKFAKNKVEWIEFADTWRERAETSRVVTVVLGRQNGKQELGTIGVGDLEGNFLCVPIRKAMRRGDNKLAAWISHNMKALHDVLRDQRILKVISPADMTFQLLLDEEIEAGQAIAPMCDPVLCAADGNPAKFNFWVDRISLEHPGFGAKIAAHYYLGRQDGPYEDDEGQGLDKDRSSEQLLAWPTTERQNYTPAQKRWLNELHGICALGVLDMTR